MSRRHESTLEHILGSRVRARLIEAFVTRPGESPHLRGLIRHAGPGVSFVKRELGELERIGLVASRRTGREVRFDVDRRHPLFDALTDLTTACRLVDASTCDTPDARSARFYEPRGDEQYPHEVRGRRRVSR